MQKKISGKLYATVTFKMPPKYHYKYWLLVIAYFFKIEWLFEKIIMDGLKVDPKIKWAE
jgi:hypothetical protein